MTVVYDFCIWPSSAHPHPCGQAWPDLSTFCPDPDKEWSDSDQIWEDPDQICLDSGQIPGQICCDSDHI